MTDSQFENQVLRRLTWIKYNPSAGLQTPVITIANSGINSIVLPFDVTRIGTPDFGTLARTEVVLDNFASEFVPSAVSNAALAVPFLPLKVPSVIGRQLESDGKLKFPLIETQK